MLQGIMLQNWNYAAELELCCSYFFEKSYAAALELCCKLELCCNVSKNKSCSIIPTPPPVQYILYFSFIKILPFCHWFHIPFWTRILIATRRLTKLLGGLMSFDWRVNSRYSSLSSCLIQNRSF